LPIVKEQISIHDWFRLCVGLEQLLDSSKTRVASKDELDLRMEPSLRYNNALLAPRSGRRETTGYLRNTATTLLSTKKIVSPQRLEQPDFLVVAQQMSSAADAPQQSAVAQIKLVVEDEAQETESETQDKVFTVSRATIKKEQNSPCETSYYRHQDMIQKRKRCIVPLPIYTRKRYDASLALLEHLGSTGLSHLRHGGMP
jgi:hypothetical protein